MFSPAPAGEPADTSFSGSAVFTLDYNENEREDDIDLSTHLRTKAEAVVFDRQVSLIFNGRFRTDVDSGASDRDQAHEERTDARIYQAYLEAQDPWAWAARIRVGRQWIHEVENVHMDGAYLATRGDQIRLTLFGGRPVSEFSSASSRHVFGGEARLRLHDFNLRLNFLENDEDLFDNRLVRTGFSRSFRDGRWRAYGDYALLGGDSREMRLGLSAFLPESNTDLSAYYYERLNKSEPDEIRDDQLFSDFYRLLGSRHEYRRLDLTLTKYFDGFALGGGGGVTSVDNANPGNRKIVHGHLNFHYFDFLVENLTLSLQGDYFRQRFSERYAQSIRQEYRDSFEDRYTDTSGRDTTVSFSGQLEYRLARRTRIAAGVGYSDYDFDSSVNTNAIFVGEFPESPQGVLTNRYLPGDLVPDLLQQDFGGSHIVRNFFVRLRTPLTAQWEVRLLLDYNRGTLSNNIKSRGYKRVLLRLTRRF